MTSGRRRRQGRLARLTVVDRQRRAWQRTGVPARVADHKRGWPVRWVQEAGR